MPSSAVSLISEKLERAAGCHTCFIVSPKLAGPYSPLSLLLCPPPLKLFSLLMVRTLGNLCLVPDWLRSDGRAIWKILGADKKSYAEILELQSRKLPLCSLVWFFSCRIAVLPPLEPSAPFRWNLLSHFLLYSSVVF